MTEEEQKMLEAMRHSEQALKAELDSRDSELQRRIAQLTASQQMLAEHEAEQSRLLAENSELKHQVCKARNLHSHIARCGIDLNTWIFSQIAKTLPQAVTHSHSVDSTSKIDICYAKIYKEKERINPILLLVAIEYVQLFYSLKVVESSAGRRDGSFG